MKLIKKKKEVNITIKEVYRLKNNIYHLDSYIYEYSEDLIREFIKFYSIKKKSEKILKEYVENNNIAILNFLEINENIRNIGIGKLILNHFIYEIKRKNIPIILLIADVKREQKTGFSLLNWYKRFGFSIIYDDKKFPVLGLKQNTFDYNDQFNIEYIKKVINDKIENLYNIRTIK